MVFFFSEVEISKKPHQPIISFLSGQGSVKTQSLPTVCLGIRRKGMPVAGKGSLSSTWVSRTWEPDVSQTSIRETATKLRTFLMWTAKTQEPENGEMYVSVAVCSNWKPLELESWVQGFTCSCSRLNAVESTLSKGRLFSQKNLSPDPEVHLLFILE